MLSAIADHFGTDTYLSLMHQFTPQPDGKAPLNRRLTKRDDSAKNGTSPDIGFMGDEIGPCPLCGAAVRRTKFGYGCSAFKEKNCKFSFNMKILGRTIPIGEARRILREGRSEVLQGFRSKKGTLFAAALKLENGRVDFDFDRGDAPAGNVEEKKG